MQRFGLAKDAVQGIAKAGFAKAYDNTTQLGDCDVVVRMRVDVGIASLDARPPCGREHWPDAVAARTSCHGRKPYRLYERLGTGVCTRGDE